jgi:hypothetical protein
MEKRDRIFRVMGMSLRVGDTARPLERIRHLAKIRWPESNLLNYLPSP